MSTITAQDIIDRAEIVLQDTTNVRWPETELLGWLNDGQREVVRVKPDSNATNESMSLVAGTKQSIPAAGLSLIDVIRNMGTGGSTPGNVIRRIDRKILDDQVPGWHSASQVSTINHYTFDDRDPKRFYVYPPADGTTQVEVVYAAAPSDIVVGATITVDDIYANALMDYILYRAYLKDADYAADDARAQAAYQSFLRSLGMQDKQEMSDDPNRRPVYVTGAVKAGGQQQ